MGCLADFPLSTTYLLRWRLGRAKVLIRRSTFILCFMLEYSPLAKDDLDLLIPELGAGCWKVSGGGANTAAGHS